MRDKLPVCIENNSIPEDNLKLPRKNNSYGYVSVLYLLSIIITLGSIITLLVIGGLKWKKVY